MAMSEKSNTATQSRFSSAWRFVEAFIREPLTVGALWPSSSRLSKLVVESCDVVPGDTVVEFGPGTGSFTGLLLQRLHGRGRMLAMELSETNIAELRRRYPHCETIHDSAENLPISMARARSASSADWHGATCCRRRKTGFLTQCLNRSRRTDSSLRLRTFMRAGFRRPDVSNGGCWKVLCGSKRPRSSGGICRRRLCIGAGEVEPRL